MIPIGSTLKGAQTSASQGLTTRPFAPWDGHRELRLGTMGMGHPTQQVDGLRHVLDALEIAGINAKLSVAGLLVVPDTRAEHVGYLDDNELLDFLASLDLFILPITDGFSGRRSAPISALGAGTAVLTTWGTETDLEQYPRDKLGLVRSGDAKLFAAQVVDMLKVPRDLNALTRQWQTIYLRDLAWPVVAAQWSQLIGANGPAR